MFERLTLWDDANKCWVEDHSRDTREWKNGHSACMNRLAAYEDIGLSPEEITDTIYRFEAFLSAMTGNRMSKSNYTLDAMISAAEEYQQSLCDECWDRSELAKYYELEHEKRLVVLPCKVGDTVYRIISYKCNAVCNKLNACNSFIYKGCKQAEFYVCPGTFKFNDIEWIGKTVFLTREEAERALSGDA
jgi:hypothetical protein